MTDFFDLIRKRESCRSFDPARPAEREKLERMIEAARLAPSACNSQPWKFCVVTNASLAEKLRPLLQGQGMNRFTDAAPAFIVAVETEANASEAIGARIKRQDFRSIDMGLAVSQLCLAATETGLSTCILGWFDEGGVKELLAIPASRRVRLVIAVGYAKSEALREKTRKAKNKMSTFLE